MEEGRFVNSTPMTTTLTTEQTRIMEILRRFNPPREELFTLIDSIPEQDLEPSAIHLDTWRLKPNSHGWHLSRIIQQQTPFIAVCKQRKGHPENYDAQGKRTPKNFALVVIV
jgi:hypothetical protein